MTSNPVLLFLGHLPLGSGLTSYHEVFLLGHPMSAVDMTSSLVLLYLGHLPQGAGLT